MDNKREKKANGSSLQAILLAVGAFLLAFIIWIYSSSLEDKTKTVTFENIPVKISTSGSFSVLNGSDYTVDVTLSGLSKVLSAVSEESITATVDASDITEAGKYTLDVVVEYPGKAELTEQSLNTVVLELDRIATMKIDAEISIGTYDISEPYEIAAISCDVSEIAVSGPSKMLSKIDRAVIKCDAGHLEASKTCGASVIFVDANGSSIENSSLSYEGVSPTISITVYTSKIVPLKYTFKGGYFDYITAKTSVSPSYITIKGENSTISSITEITLPAIDEKQILSDTVTKDIVLPEGVYLASETSVATVTVILSNYYENTLILTPDDFDVFNPNELEYSFVNEECEFTVRGPYTPTYYINGAGVKASIDLSTITEKGTFALPVTIIFPSAYKAQVYEVGSYTVLVEVR